MVVFAFGDGSGVMAKFRTPCCTFVGSRSGIIYSCDNVYELFVG